MKHRAIRRSGRARLWGAFSGALMVLSLLVALPGTASAQRHEPSYAGQVTSNLYRPGAGSGPQPVDRGATVDPLRYDCTFGGPACENVGLSHGWYSRPGTERGTNVDFLYTARNYCDPSVRSHASSGCEAGATYRKLPLGANTQDPLYIIVPLGFHPSNLQCPRVGHCEL